MRRVIADVVLALALCLGLGIPEAVALPPGSSTDRGLELRLGLFLPDGGGELWSINEDLFSLDASDFEDATFGLSWVQSLTNHIELGVGFEAYERTVRSAQRGFIDDFGLPILHDTQLSLTPLTVDVRFLPLGRFRQRPGGRQVLKPVVWVGGAAGLMRWEYEELGDFVFSDDEGDLVLFDRFRGRGTTSVFQVAAGLELPLSTRINLILQARQTWADDDLDFDDAYGGPARLDFGGTTLSGGVALRF